MFQNLLILLFVVTIIFILLCFYKSLKLKKLKKKIPCGFSISTPKFHKNKDVRIATFEIGSIDKNAFFINFPILFKFYADTRFKTKVKIKYKAAKKDNLEEIINKTIVFETKTIECKHRIDDIIIGNIYIEISLKSEYGYPIVEFEILENDYCYLDKEYKKIIKFPKIN